MLLTWYVQTLVSPRTISVYYSGVLPQQIPMAYTPPHFNITKKSKSWIVSKLSEVVGYTFHLQSIRRNTVSNQTKG